MMYPPHALPALVQPPVGQCYRLSTGCRPVGSAASFVPELRASRGSTLHQATHHPAEPRPVRSWLSKEPACPAVLQRVSANDGPLSLQAADQLRRRRSYSRAVFFRRTGSVSLPGLLVPLMRSGGSGTQVRVVCPLGL